MTRAKQHWEHVTVTYGGARAGAVTQQMRWPLDSERVPRDLIQDKLERVIVIVSGAFDASPRNRAFLRLIIEETRPSCSL